MDFQDDSGSSILKLTDGGAGANVTLVGNGIVTGANSVTLQLDNAAHSIGDGGVVSANALFARGFQAGGAAGNVTQVNSINTGGLGVSPIYGTPDNRIGVSGTDGSPITLYTTITATGIFKVFWRVFGNTATVTSAIYTLTWTEAGDAETDTVSISAVDTEVTKVKVIQPDTASVITVQLTTLTGASGTVNLAAWVEQVTA
jgi:hypothetical protein